uniref:Variant surface glycoprotein 814 n=1 Tax=Trypanosoma brucei TaxID=5691 RepID=M4T2E6_9TRYP|nr:variant surface glycoprotein 814 [Trypanosoma brucei]
MQLAALAAALLTATLKVAATTPSAATAAAEAANDPCKAILFLDTLTANIEGQISSAINKAQQLTEEFQQLQAATAAAASGHQQLGYGILLAIANEAKYAALNSITQHQKTLQKAANAAANLPATINVIHNRNADQKITVTATGTGTTVAGKAADAARNCQYGAVAISATQQMCNFDEMSTGALARSQITTKGLTKIPYPAEGFLTTTTLAATAYVKGSAHTTATGQAGAYCGSDSTAFGAGPEIQATVALGLFIDQKQTLAAIAPTALTEQGGEDCITEKPNSNAQTEAKSRILAAICVATRVKLQDPKSALQTTKTDLKVGGKYQHITAAAMKGYGLLELSATKLDEEAARKFIDTVFGAGDKAIAENIVEKLSSNNIKYAGAAKSETKNAKQISESKETSIALAFFISQTNKPTTPTEEKQVVDPKHGEKCKGKPQCECKEENGCEFKDGECQDKVITTAEETNGRPTNTTGSNSFVINKAPLWLAFLFLDLVFKRMFATFYEIDRNLLFR